MGDEYRKKTETTSPKRFALFFWCVTRFANPQKLFISATSRREILYVPFSSFYR